MIALLLFSIISQSLGALIAIDLGTENIKVSYT